MYVPKPHIIFCMLLNFLNIQSLWVMTHGRGGLFCEDIHQRNDCLCVAVAYFLLWVNRPLTQDCWWRCQFHTRVVSPDQCVTCWLFLASQATRLPLVGPALRCPFSFCVNSGSNMAQCCSTASVSPLWGPHRHSWSHCRTPEGIWAWISTNALNCLEWDSSWAPDS